MRTANQATNAEFLLGIARVGAYIAALRLLVGTVESSIELSRQHERAFVRLSQELHNANIGQTAQEWYDYAEARQRATGIDRDATAALATQLIQLRFNVSQTQQLVEVLQDAQAEGIGRTGTGTDPRQIATAIATFVNTGTTRGLIKFGIDVDQVKKSADQVQNIIDQLRQHTQGNVELMVHTTSGQFDLLVNQWRSTWQDFANVAAPYLNNLLDFFRLYPEALQAFIRGPLTTLSHALGFETGTEQTAARVAGENRVVQSWDNIEANTKETATNTRRMADSLVAATLGAAGTIVKETATIRNLNQAIKIGG